MQAPMRQFALAALLGVLLTGCGKKDESAPVQPQADACASNKDWAKLTEAQRAELCSKCPRCGVFESSEPKKW